MGQRHQAFLIARVHASRIDPTQLKYRCVAAIHHQWCYAKLPLRAAHLFERLANQKDNAALLLDDLKQYAERNDSNPAHPCPYAEWLLFNAFSSRSSAVLLEANMGSLAGGTGCL